MKYPSIMDKMTDDILEELREEEATANEPKKAFYTKFPKELLESFEKAIAPSSPTKAFTKFMTKVVKKSPKKKS